MSGLVKAKKFNIEDSNIALLGSDLEKEVKKAAAQCEPSWFNAGKELGLQIWRIEKFKVVHWPKEEYGNFFSGDSYIVLNTYTEKDSDKRKFDVHFWIGRESSQDEYGTAAYKTVELDDYLDGEPVQHREVQDHETNLFLGYFKKISFMDGGVDTGFRHVEPEVYRPRLLHIKGGNRKVTMREVALERDSLNSGDVFVVDAGLDIYQFNGAAASGMEKMKAGQLVRALDDERAGKATVHVFEEDDDFGDGRPEFFGHLLGGEGQIKSAEEANKDKDEKAPRRLFRLSDATGKLAFTECASARKSELDTNDVFVLDAGFEVFVWIGRGSNAQERKNGLGYATQYLADYGRPKYLPISRILEGGENEVFEQAFENVQ